MSEKALRILCVVGARPNFMKIAPLVHALRAAGDAVEATLLHTGQHYDQAMKDAFFRQLDIPEPDVDLGVGSGSHAVQTAQIMLRVEPVLDEIQPDQVLVVGDVNSTIACSLVAVKKGIPVVHVEAGLRSFDRGMPEEINRVLTDQISDLLFTTEPDAETNLLREGIDAARIHHVGNVMIDTLRRNLDRAVPAAETIARLGRPGVGAGEFGLLTLHRPSNVDDPRKLEQLLRDMVTVSRQVPLVFPLHPRTGARIGEAGLDGYLAEAGILVAEPMGYHEMLGLMRHARLVLTDSGGIQEETTALGVPCLTLRENTERPATVEQGTNTIVGTSSEAIHAAVAEILDNGGKQGRVPPLWDGHAAERIVDILLRRDG